MPGLPPTAPPVCGRPYGPPRHRESGRHPLCRCIATAEIAARDRQKRSRATPHCSLVVPNGGGSGRGPKGPQSWGGGPYRMGGSRGPPTGELRRGTPGKGGGPFAATFTCGAETDVLKCSAATGQPRPRTSGAQAGQRGGTGLKGFPVVAPLLCEQAGAEARGLCQRTLAQVTPRHL